MYKVYKTKVGEKSKPCKGGAYNTAERGWFADAVRRVVVKPGKYLRRGLHKANEQITFAKLELGWSWSSLFHCPILIPLAASLSWPRGIEECLSLICWHPALYMHAQEAALMPGSHWCCWHSSALQSSGLVQWLLGTVAKRSWKSVLTSYVIHAVFLKQC